MKHSHICKVFEAFEDDGRICIVEENCSEGPLLQWLAKNKDKDLTKGGFLVQDKITDVLACLVYALQYLHSSDKIHGQINASNVLVNNGGTFKLGSISICSPNNLPPSPISPESAIAAPELFDNKPYSSASDIWALGCLIHYLCTKQDFPVCAI